MIGMQGVATLKKQTRWFINQNPTSVVLNRKTKVDDGAGGSTYTTKPLDPQTVRLIESNPVNVTTRNVSGSMDLPQRFIVATADADVIEGDTFTDQGNKYRVGYVLRRPYELTAEVFRG